MKISLLAFPTFPLKLNWNITSNPSPSSFHLFYFPLQLLTRFVVNFACFFVVSTPLEKYICCYRESNKHFNTSYVFTVDAETRDSISLFSSNSISCSRSKKRRGELQWDEIWWQMFRRGEKMWGVWKVFFL